MVEKINDVKCKMIGLSFLSGDEGRRVKAAWDARFYSHDAFFVEVAKGQTANQMSQKVFDALREQGIYTVVGVTMLAVIFLDLSQQADIDTVRQMLNVPNQLCQILGCKIPLTLEFGYLGQTAFSDKEKLRENVRRAVDINISMPDTRKQLCLVADLPLVDKEKSSNWRAVTVLIDVLRRLNAPATVLPIVEGNGANDDVGFIRYAEYNPGRLAELYQGKSVIVEKLGSGGGEKFQSALQRVYSGIRYGVESGERYAFSAKLFPRHPGLTVNGVLKKRSAARGGNREYNDASAKTREALELTGKRMVQMAREDHAALLANPEEQLDALLDEALVGIELESQPEKMRQLLTQGMEEPMLQAAPFFTYGDQSIDSKIEAYLSSMRRYAANMVIKEYQTGLLRAYEKRDAAYYSEKRAKLKDQLAESMIRVGNVLTRDGFIDLATGMALLPESCFFSVITNDGKQFKFVLARNDADADDIDRVAASWHACKVYHVDAKDGGIKGADGVSLEAVQLMLFNGDDTVLKKLIN